MSGAAGATNHEPIIEVAGVSKTYWRGKERVDVLAGLDLVVPRGDYLALMGPSGSGKSTLLNLIAGLDTPTSGTVKVAGAALHSMGDRARARWRADHIGFVFQSYNLIPVLTAEENVALPLLLARLGRHERRERARTALRIVGLEDRLSHRPGQLSGGQEQRVAIARAIVADPAIIVADEPTGDLDRASTEEVLRMFEVLNRDLKKTIVMVTHDPAVAGRALSNRHLDKGTLA